MGMLFVANLDICVEVFDMCLPLLANSVYEQEALHNHVPSLV